MLEFLSFLRKIIKRTTTQRKRGNRERPEGYVSHRVTEKCQRKVREDNRYLDSTIFNEIASSPRFSQRQDACLSLISRVQLPQPSLLSLRAQRNNLLILLFNFIFSLLPLALPLLLCVTFPFMPSPYISILALA